MKENETLNSGISAKIHKYKFWGSRLGLVNTRRPCGDYIPMTVNRDFFFVPQGPSMLTSCIERTFKLNYVHHVYISSVQSVCNVYKNVYYIMQYYLGSVQHYFFLCFFRIRQYKAYYYEEDNLTQGV